MIEVRVVDRNAELIEAFRREVDASMPLAFSVGDALDESAGAIVTPGNSFGFMDGGFAAAAAFRWPHAPELVREEIARLPFGELAVGKAIVVPTHDPLIPHLVYAPTMRAPGPVHDPSLVMLACRAAVSVAIACGTRSVVMPGMGTGAGRLPPVTAAAAMVGGIQAARFPPPRPLTWHEAAQRHFALNG